jgi:hypothetical protein
MRLQIVWIVPILRKNHLMLLICIRFKREDDSFVRMFANEHKTVRIGTDRRSVPIFRRALYTN